MTSGAIVDAERESRGFSMKRRSLPEIFVEARPLIRERAALVPNVAWVIHASQPRLIHPKRGLIIAVFACRVQTAWSLCVESTPNIGERSFSLSCIRETTRATSSPRFSNQPMVTFTHVDSFPFFKTSPAFLEREIANYCNYCDTSFVKYENIKIK